MLVIREYALKNEAVQTIELPKGARPIAATGRLVNFSVIALIDPMEEEQTLHRVIAIKSGDKLPYEVDAARLQFLERQDNFIFIHPGI